MENQSMAGKTLHRGIVWISYLLVAFTPVIFFTAGVNELFEFPKMILVYLAGLTMSALFLSKAILTGDKIKLGSAPLFGFLAANLLSTIFSVNHYTSIWGYYTRFNGGLASIAMFTVIFVVISNELSSKEKGRLLDVMVVGSIPVCIYAIAQAMGFQKGFWQEDSQSRVFSTLGQPNWLAAYILLVLFPLVDKGLKNIGKTKIIIFLGALLCLATLWFTYSLSGLLGLAAGTISFAVLAPRRLLKANSIFLLALGLSFLAIAVIRPGAFGPKLHDAILDIRKNVSLVKISYAQGPDAEKNIYGDTTGIRLAVWRGTLNLITSSPKNFLIGTGPETYPYAFLPFRPQELNRTTEWDFVFNKPHNYYLELASNLGVLGLVSYLAFATSLVKKGSYPVSAALVALFVSDLFGWHTVAASLLMYVFAALAKEYGRE